MATDRGMLVLSSVKSININLINNIFDLIMPLGIVTENMLRKICMKQGYVGHSRQTRSP